MKCSDFVPPILTQLARRLRSGANRSKITAKPYERRATYLTYDEASKHCATRGYEAADLVEVVFQKTVAFRDSLLTSPPPMTLSDSLALFALGLSSSSSEPITVLDFGGACGAHYFRMRALIQPHVRLRWHVIETSAMSRRAAQLQTDELSFSDSLAAAKRSLGQIDIAFSSGTLQCVPDPHQTLTDLLDCHASYLVLPRLGMSETSKAVITIHEARLSYNGHGPMPPGMEDGVTEYPFTFASRTSIEACIAKNYEIILTMADPSGVYPVNNEPLVGLGYIARAKACLQHA